MAGSTVSGLISGMDTQGIIEKMMQLEKLPMERLQKSQDTLKAKLAAWQDANTRVLAVKDKASAIANVNTFNAKLVSSNDDTILKGTADYTAQAGTYYITVNKLARAHQLKTEGYADTMTTTVGTGKIDIRIGSATATPVTVNITNPNTTLTGLRDAINQAGAGVTASILNDGTGTNQYHLVLTSNTTGASGEVFVDSQLSGGTGPSFTTLQAAQNAELTLGEGAGAIQISANSNTVADMIPGVTLNLQKVDQGKTVTLTVAPDTTSIKKSIKDFVDQYNNLITYINAQFKYDAGSSSGGTLFANSDLRAIQIDVVDKVTSPIVGLTQDKIVLSQIGLTLDSDNKLVINESELDAALNASVDDVKRLFANAGSTTDSRATFLNSTEATKVSTTGGYGITITQNATQTYVTSEVAQTASLAQDETLKINGTEVKLLAGWTQAQVIAEINKNSGKTGVSVRATDATGQGSGNYLTFTSLGYGSSRSINITSNVATASDSTGVNITSSSITAGAKQTESLAQDETLTINGVNILLKQGMSQSAVVSEINKHTSETKVTASATRADGTGTGQYLTLTGQLPGDSEQISVVSNVSNGGATPSVKTSGIGNVTVTQDSAGGETGAAGGVAGTGRVGAGIGTLGLDVAGSYTVKVGEAYVTETATGKGQVLTGSEGNANTAGLSVMITGSTPGDYGKVTFSKGAGALVSDYLSYITATGTGSISAAQTSLQSQIDDLTKQMNTFESRLGSRRDALVTKFAIMESTIARLQGQGTSLSSLSQTATKK